MDEKLERDLFLYGVCFYRPDGTRVDPKDVFIDAEEKDTNQ